jgi:uncharacterized iron-regulated membrane protein
MIYPGHDWTSKNSETSSQNKIVNIRKIVFWSHLVIGIIAGIVILSMTVTGSILSFERQITAWAERDVRHIEPPSGAQRLEPEALLQRFKEQLPEARPSEIAFFADPHSTAQVSVGREKRYYLNPYTGDLLGEGSPQLRAFFALITEWHRWFTLQKDWKEVGKAITGAGAMAFLLLLLSGLVLWFPGKATVAVFKSILMLNFKLKGKPRHWNWHHAIGFWCAPLILILTVTGLIISYTWANNLLYKAASTEPPLVRKNEGGGEKKPPVPQEVIDLNSKWKTAQIQVPEWQSIRLRFPTSEKDPINFIIDAGNGMRPDTRSQLRLNRETGEVLKHETYESLNKGRQWRMWVKPIHTGEAGGIIGQFLALIAAVGSALLVWTGFSLTLYRFGILKKKTASLRNARKHEKKSLY